jgi:UDP-N-acetyl-2-amino-2-deoxyglucuronate dehydrogenase
MDKMKKLGFAIIGCGRIASKHCAIIANQLENTELVAVCDCVKERAKVYGDKYKVPYYTDIHEMMNHCKDKIDVINILTPSGLHAEMVLEVVVYGKHIVVEKPMALTLHDADKMIDACSKANVKLFVVKQNRYNLPVQKLRTAIEEGKFGKLNLGTVRVRWCREQKYYDQDKWRGTWRYDGGVFANQASHHVDLLQWMMGDVESVFAKAATQLVNIEAEDTGVVVIRFKNGALGVIEATTATRPNDLEGSISILGEKGTAEIGGFAVNKMKTWNFVDHGEYAEKVTDQYDQNPPDVYGFGHVEYLKNVVECVLYNKKALVDGYEGRKSLELIAAIYESIESKREVNLPFISKYSKLGRE